MTIFIRRKIPQRAMRAVFIVIDFPGVGAFAHFVKVTEQIEAKKLLTVRTIESFDIGVLIRLAQFDVPYRHPGLLRPCHEVAA